MKILLADKQDITRAGLSYVISKMEGLETRTIEDKADLMLALKENEDTVVILDYTLFDINDAAELLILNQRFPYTRWLLFSEDLSADFVKILIASSTQFSVLLKECSLMELKEAIRFLCGKQPFCLPAHDGGTSGSETGGAGENQPHQDRDRDSEGHCAGNDDERNSREALFQLPYSQYPPQEHLPQVGRKQRSRGYEICAESRFG